MPASSTGATRRPRRQRRSRSPTSRSLRRRSPGRWRRRSPFAAKASSAAAPTTASSRSRARATRPRRTSRSRSTRLPLTPLQPYLRTALAVPLAGVLSADVGVRWQAGGDAPNLKVEARRVALARLSLGDAKTSDLGAELIEVSDARADTVARTASIGQLTLRAPRVRVERDATKRWSFERWAASTPASSGASAPALASASASASLSPSSSSRRRHRAATRRPGSSRSASSPWRRAASPSSTAPSRCRSRSTSPTSPCS